MPSTYSPNLRIELIATGEQAGTWGNTTNTNLGTLIEDAIAGYVSVSVTSANQALTANNGTADQSRNMVINLTTTTSANFNVYIPPAEKFYVIRNSSAYQATVFCSTVLGNTTAAGTGVAIPAGRETIVFSDATNVVIGMDYLPSLALGTDLAIADGGTGASDAPTARTNLGATTIGGNLFTLTNPGAITFPRFNADSTVSALDAASFRTAIGAGTGTGTVTSVAVSGGTTGLTTSGGPVSGSGTITLAGTLAVANGGTGGTTQATARSGIGTVSDPGSNGIAARTSANTLTARTITAGTAISVANGDGVSGNPTITNTGVTSVAAGTGISVSASTGGVTISASGGGGGQIQSQLFVSSGTWTAPTGVTRVRVTVVGGGGGGAADWCVNGGVGGIAIGVYTVTPSTGYAVTVGGGGNGGTGAGASGGTSSFSSLVSATGGGGGTSGGPGGNGTGSNGNLRNTNLIVLAGNTFSDTASLAGGVISGATYRGSGSTGVAYSISSTFTAGAAGQSGVLGGVGGAVYVEWVGA